MTKLTLDLEWRTTLLTLLLLPLLVTLGFWQLERAAEKTLIAEQDAMRAAAPAQPLATLLDAPPEELAYRRVTVSGYFLPEPLIYLDNQIRDGRYGHDVFGLFYDRSSARYALINRGWVPGDSSRRSLPEVSTPEQDLTLSATVYVPPGEPYLLAEEQFAGRESPLLVQSVVSPALRALVSRDLAQPLFAWELRMTPEQPGGFRRDWPVVNVSPEKHRGYALQWFTMAAALLLLFIVRSSNILSLVRGQSPRTGPGSSNSKEQ
jgi:cytochrome oxidase assembly protein ShyY1